MQLVCKAATLVQDHLNTFADAVFHTPSVMMKEMGMMEAMCESTKYIVQEYVPDSTQGDNENRSNHVAEMKVMNRNVSLSSCLSCYLPILCNINGKCVFCLQDIPVPSLIHTFQESSGVPTFVHLVHSNESVSSSQSKVSSESIVQTEECSKSVNSNTSTSYLVPDMSDPRIGLNISLEVGKHLANGWRMTENRFCLKCGTLMMCGGDQTQSSSPICLLCDVVLKKTNCLILSDYNNVER